MGLISKDADGLQPHKDFESDSFTIGLEGDLEAYPGILIEMDPGDTGGADSPNDIFSNDSLYPTQLEETCLKQD